MGVSRPLQSVAMVMGGVSSAVVSVGGGGFGNVDAGFDG